MPLFALDDPPQYTLADAPLAQALAQVRFPLIAELESMAGIAPVQTRLRNLFPYMEQLKTQEISFLAGPAGPAAGAAESTSWNLTNDEGYELAVSAGSASLSIGPTYSTVDDFTSVLREVIVALAELGLPRCDRLGVRYLSLAPDLPGQPGAWREWFRPEFLGWAGTTLLPIECLANSISQVQLSAPAVGDLSGPPADVQAIIRHGFVPAGSLVPGVPPINIAEPSFLLDVDVFSAGRQSFDADRLIDQFRLFHAQVDRFFYWSLSAAGGEHFGLEERNG